MWQPVQTWLRTTATPFFPADTQTVVMAEDGLGDHAAQFGGLRFNVLAGGFAKLQRLELQQILQHNIHTIVLRKFRAKAVKWLPKDKFLPPMSESQRAVTCTHRPVQQSSLRHPANLASPSAPFLIQVLCQASLRTTLKENWHRLSSRAAPVRVLGPRVRAWQYLSGPLSACESYAWRTWEQRAPGRRRVAAEVGLPGQPRAGLVVQQLQAQGVGVADVTGFVDSLIILVLHSFLMVAD